MRLSREAMSIYEDTHQIWRDNNIAPHHESYHNQKVDFDIAKKAIKKFWKSESPKKIGFLTLFKETRGNRRTWVERYKSTTLKINTESGWAHIVHDVSHLIWYRKGFWKKKPHHCADHAILERRFARLVVEKYLN